MANLGIKGGIYWFSYALNTEMARKEGVAAVNHAKKYWKNCIIAYDFEYDSVNYGRKHGVDISKKMSTSMAIAFLDEVQNAGYIPCLYLNEDYWRNHFDVDTIKKYIPQLRIWYASWYSKNTKSIVTDLPEDKKMLVDIWQFSSKGSVPGISGNVDMDEMYESAELYSSENSITNSQKPVKNINVLNFQKAANSDGYSKPKLVEDGIDGPKTQSVRKSINLQAKCSEEHWVIGSTGETVKWVQNRLKELGYYDGSVDGLYGPKTRKAVISFQGKNGLSTDGIAGYNTISMLFYI
jgi:GH25 family lysozyme M1 (1,4-beta-N-acetylmuramidase)